MTPERWQKIAELFERATARPPEAQTAFLDEACAGDDALRCEVEAMLAADCDADGEADFENTATAVAAAWATEKHADDSIGKKLGRYEVLSVLGAGGMGEVYLAQDTTLDRKVALKLLPKQFTQNRDRLRRFEQEARAVSALNHPNIITIYEIGECDGTRFLAAEYVEGRTLRGYVGSTAEVLEIGVQAAGALAAAHGAGIVHRDIKPANIMLRRDGFVKVLDFGLAKLVGSPRAETVEELTAIGGVLGTIHYMSPEQAMGQGVDHRTDIFSLGLVLYEIATGRRVFEGQSAAAVYDSILHKEVPPIRELVPDVPLEFDHVIRRALAKDPEHRYGSADELRLDLKRLVHGTEITEAARAVAQENRAQRHARASRLAAAAALAFGVAATLFFFVGKFARENSTTTAARESSTKPIAVLPFENRSSETDSGYFAEGVHDQILTSLAKVASLKVIGRASVLPYKAGVPRNLREISHGLGAGYVLEGSVQRAADRVRVNALLTETTTATQLWAESYESELADVFGLQSRIAKDIATQLHAKLSALERAEIERKPTSDVSALELYTRGKNLIELSDSGSGNSHDSLFAAIELLNEAVRRDPRFVNAYAMLARAHDIIYASGLDHSAARFAQAQAAIDAALRLAPDSGETHLANAWHLYAKRDFARTEQELLAAQRTLPNDPRTLALSAYYHRRLGRWDQSTRELEQALELDPRNVDILLQLPANYHALRNYAGYVGTHERLIALAPELIGPRLWRATADMFWFGDTKPLHNLVEAQLKREPASAPALMQHIFMLGFYERDPDRLAQGLALLGDDRWYGNDHQKFRRPFAEGMLAHLRGDAATARTRFLQARAQQERLLEAQADYPQAVSMLGLIDAVLGRKEEALREGRRAVELLPVANDSIAGPAMVWNLVIIAGWIGENDLALELLRDLLQKPAGPQYGHLKLDPLFDPLRSDPRFQGLLVEFAPKDQ